MATCVKCGKLNYEGVKICTACGTPLPVTQSEESYSDNEEEYRNEENDAQPQQNAQSDSKDEERDEEEKKGLNKKIIYIVLGVLVAIGLFFLVKFLLSSNDVSKLQFSVSPSDSLRLIDTELTFTDNSEGAKTWIWDFGDGTDEEMTQSVKHIYSAAGSYMVYLTVNNKFKDSILISIIDNKVEALAPDTIIPNKTEAIISMTPSSPVTVGKAVTFTDNTPGATKWEWRFNEDGKINATTKTAVYKFKFPKRKRVISVNNDVSLTGTFELEVLDEQDVVVKKPEEKKTDKKEEKKEEKKSEKTVAEPKNNAKDLKDLQIAFNSLASKNKASSDSKKEKDFLSKLFNETDPNKIDVYVKVTHKGKTTEQSIHDVISDVIFTKPAVKVKSGFKNAKNAFQNIEIEY